MTSRNEIMKKNISKCGIRAKIKIFNHYTTLSCLSSYYGPLPLDEYYQHIRIYIKDYPLYTKDELFGHLSCINNVLALVQAYIYDMTLLEIYTISHYTMIHHNTKFLTLWTIICLKSYEFDKVSCSSLEEALNYHNLLKHKLGK